MGVDKCPIGTCENWADQYTHKMMVNRAWQFWNKYECYHKKFPDSIQGRTGKCGGGKQRMKVHANAFYSTAVEDKRLRKCKMKFEDMFTTVKQRKTIEVFLTNCYLLARSVGIPHGDCKYLLDVNEVIYLTTIYNGVGINSHRDANFKGPVFWYVSYIKKERDTVKDLDANKLQGKCISWGIKGTMLMIDKSWIQNHSNQLYWFYGYMTEWGVHGVPGMKDFITIVHIFRQARPERYIEE